MGISTPVLIKIIISAIFLLIGIISYIVYRVAKNNHSVDPEWEDRQIELQEEMKRQRQENEALDNELASMANDYND